MTSKLIYLLMDCETFNQLPAFEKVRDLFRTRSNIFYETFSKTFSNVKLKALANQANRIILDV